MATTSISFFSFFGTKKRDLYSAGRRLQQLEATYHPQAGVPKTTLAKSNLLLQRTVTTRSTSQWHSCSDLHNGSSTKQAAPAGQIADLRPETQMTVEERKQIDGFRIPEFASPEITAWCTSEIHPLWATASKDVHQWFLHRRVDSAFHPGVYNKFCSLKFAELPAMVYVDAGPQGLDLAVKFFLWSYALDDLIDNTVVGMSLGTSLPFWLEMYLVLMWSFPEDPVLNEKLMSVVDAFPSSKLKKATLEVIDTELSRAKRFPGTVYDGKLSPLGLCIRDIWTTIVETGSEISSLRFAHSLQHYFMGATEESKNREGNAIPSVEDYILIRRGVGGVEATVVIADLVYKMQLSDDLFQSLQMQQFLMATNDIICWHNDLWSFKKEISRGDTHNLVFVVSHERKCSYAEAAFIARDMIESRMADWRKAAAGLQAVVNLETADQQAMSMYINVCSRWLSATEAFHRARATTRFEMAY